MKPLKSSVQIRIVLLLILLLINLVFLEVGRASSTTLDTASASFDAYMTSYTATTTKLLETENVARMVYAATELPFTGRVFRVSSSGTADLSCTGTLISPHLVLTAAHCVCEQANGGYWLTASTCMAHHAQSLHSTIVFFPAAGVFKGTGRVWIEPDYYQYRSDQAIKRNVPLADLAILELVDSPPIRPVAIDQDNTTPIRILSEGFGMFTHMPDPRAPLGSAVPSYGPGVGNAVVQMLTACRPGHNDVVCTRYGATNYDAVSGNAAACPGDSGGPLFSMPSGATPTIFGVISGRESAQSDNDCSANAESLTTYTVVSTHANWIASVIKNDKNPIIAESMIGCREAMLMSDSNWTLTFVPHSGAHSAVVSVSVVTNLSSDDAGTVAPVVREIGCASVAGVQSVLSCHTTGKEAISVQFSGDILGQSSICEYR